MTNQETIQDAIKRFNDTHPQITNGSVDRFLHTVSIQPNERAALSIVPQAFNDEKLKPEEEHINGLLSTLLSDMETPVTLQTTVTEMQALAQTYNSIKKTSPETQHYQVFQVDTPFVGTTITFSYQPDQTVPVSLIIAYNPNPSE